MEVLNLLELLEDIIEEGSKLPFGNKVMIDKSKALEILRDVRISLPDEVKQAEWINSESSFDFINFLSLFIALFRIIPVYITGSFVVENGGAYAKSKWNKSSTFAL